MGNVDGLPACHEIKIWISISCVDHPAEGELCVSRLEAANPIMIQMLDEERDSLNLAVCSAECLAVPKSIVLKQQPFDLQVLLLKAMPHFWNEALVEPGQIG